MDIRSLNNKLIIPMLLSALTVGCFSVKYDFRGGASIDPDIETLSVQYFDNRASRVEPTLSQKFTEEFKAYMENNTSLRVVNSIGDVDFSGEITDYSIRSSGIGAGDVAQQTRFTITIRVKYTNHINPDEDFDQSFSRFREFESTTDFESVEDRFTDEIIDEILEQIFNKAFVNW